MGNTVVLKPSEETPVSRRRADRRRSSRKPESPKGVFNVVTCSRDNVAEVGDELIANPAVRGISFTGSTAVGKQSRRRKPAGCSRSACVELGGKDALIVLDDADIEHARQRGDLRLVHAPGADLHVRRARDRLHQDVATEFTEKFVANTKKLKVGNPREMGNCIGPIINQKQLDKIRDQVDDAVAQGRQGAVRRQAPGLFFEPTVLTNVTRDMKVMREETFGPSRRSSRLQNVDEAVAVANDTEYGLSAGIMTRDEERGLAIARRLQTGMAHIN